ncbi:MAG: ABC transporter ATP-binding protein [Erysipelotrichaceae bacterium]|nr:ABC transporter ATP-binding protein [Erysipelotrichaceae bacterium]
MNYKKYIKNYYFKFSGLLILGVLADIIVDITQLYIPEFLSSIVEIVSSNNNVVYADIKDIVVKVIVVAFILFVGRILFRVAIMPASQKIEAGIRHDMFTKAERLSQRYYHENKVGTIMSWFSSDLEAVEEFTGWGTIMMVDAIFLSSLAIYKMCSLDYTLSVIAIIPMLALIVWGNKVEKTMSDKWEEKQRYYDKLYDFTQENFTGIRVIKAFVKEKQEQKAFKRIAQENSDKNLEFANLSISFDVCIELIIGIAMSMVLGFGSYFVYRNSINNPVFFLGRQVSLTISQLIAFIGYVDILIWPMIAMGQILQMHSRFKASLIRIVHFLNEEEEIASSSNATRLIDCKGKITFNNFSFVYPKKDKIILDKISFEILPGEMVGIVGKIGSGKTTLVNSLLHLYNIDKECIYIDDIDLMDIDINSLRENIAYVPQDNFLFSDDIKNNIIFSNEKVEVNKVKEAAIFAAVDDNIKEFPEGYYTMTGERGVALSGGQKQRISIARAYIKDSPIMILDDSVSAVDVKTEETILNNIKEKRKGKTTIIIASRVSTVSSLDKILVLNAGKVEAFGKPDDLLKTSPTYKKMVYLQKLENEL